ncbi:MAG: ABC transporter substrate-binding protein, partial [Proteobacteria bacterium]|nr:ABC transporter substrate-binding protein [Pseudomonadota bacterium]
GQLTLTTDVEDFPGFPEVIQGPELMTNMRKQAQRLGADFVDGNVTSVDFSSKPFKVSTNSESFAGKTIVLATGASAKWLGLPSEQKLIGKGVSSCAVCDAAFFRGKKIALVYHNSAYGKEPIRTLEVAAKKFGFELLLLPVDHPGQEQKATWLRIRKEKPDWVLMWGWGVMNQVAIKEAGSIRYPMNRFIGAWWSGSENDVLPAGAAADGYLSGAFHQPGDNFPAHDDIKKYIYDAGKGLGERARIGEVLYNRGLVAAMWTAEAIRTAMAIHGTNKVTGKHVRDGFEALDVDEARLKELGLPGFTIPVKITCENHEGPGQVALQQWDAKAKKWSMVTGFYEPLRDITGPLVAADSAQYAAENNVTARTC